ncbi:SDR family oxidoreductase [Nonomuraea sp. SBT364]|uniref:SDR family oxidoreductase n=1 Tax=Nonomuraea sp. SBT364 TaxID=1580530 RepID=UPI00066D4BEC|nr:NAD(P)H-binding protein [Nonomuraea sp. SBT364]
MLIMLTGATGTLGRAAVPALLRAGHEIRALSREDQARRDVTWVRGDLATGYGVREAVAGCDAVAHLAALDRATAGDLLSRPGTAPGALTVDATGTRALVAAAREAGVAHLLHVSAVGAGRAGPLRRRSEAERLVRESGVAFTVLRTTHLHQRLDRVLRGLAGSPVLPVDRTLPWQPVDTSEVAGRLTGLLAGGPRRTVIEYGGPQVLATPELVATWLTARRLRRLCPPLRYPGKVAAAQRAGALTTDATPTGRITWHDYLNPPPMPSEDFAEEHTASPTSPANQPERDPDRHVYGGDEGYQRPTRG